MTGQEVSAFLQSISTTITFAKGLRAIGNATELNQKLLPLLEKIVSMEEHANSMAAFIRKLEEENEAYRKKLMEFEKWDETERNHEAIFVIPDIRAYVQKGLNDKSRQSANWYCTNCWADRIKSILHPESITEHGVSYFCPKCKNKFRHAIIPPSEPNPMGEW